MKTGPHRFSPVPGGSETMKGTEGLGYWEFRKKFCLPREWRLQRIQPQVYVVVDATGERIGVFRSGEGYRPEDAPS